MKTKNITKKILSYTLSIMIIMSTLSFPVLAGDAAFSISVTTPAIVGKMVTVTGELSDNAERLVSIFVLPKEISGTEMNSVDNMLTLRSTDASALYQNVVYMNSASNSTENGFTFEFKVPSEGYYYIFMDSPGAAAFTPVYVYVKGIMDYLSEAGDDEDSFNAVLLNSIEDTGAGMLDTFDKFSPEQKGGVASYVFAYRPYADKAALGAKVDAGIQSVLDSLLTEIKSNAATPENILELIANNEEILGVTKLDVYENVLDDTRKTSVKTALSTGAASFTQLSDCKDCFDNAVTAAVAAMKTEILGALNGAATPEDFGAKLLLYKKILGMTESQLGLLDRLSTTMCNTLYGKMMDDPDFDEYSDVPASFDAAKAEIGENAIALDIINNKEKSAAKIIEILYEFEALLTGLNKADYELLKDGENVYYQNQVKEKFLSEMPYASLEAVVTAFNDLVAEQKSAKETVTALRASDYDTIQTIITNNHTTLGISETDYSNYQYIEGASSGRFTDLINTLLMYKEQYTDAGAFAFIFAREVTAVKNSLPSGSDPSPGPSSSGSNSGKNIGTKTEPAKNAESAVNSETVFTDLGSVSWAKEQILYLADKGILNGKGNNLFDPNGYVTREEFVKMIVTAFNIHNADAASSFSDSDNSKWYDSYIASAADKGIVKGSDNGSFGVGQNITREDMTVLVYRILKSEKNFIAQSTNEVFDDNANISDYAAEGIYALKSAGYVNGMGNNMFGPKNYCTRAEAAVIIYNVIK